MAKHTGLAVLESQWWKGLNTSVRGLFELVADISSDNPHAYHYEMANCEAAAKEAIPRIASYRHCKYLCMATHGGEDGLYFINDEKITRAELRNILVKIKSAKGSALHGIHFASCNFSTQNLAEFLFQGDIGVHWVSGYSESVEFIDSSAMDLLFLNQLVFRDSSETYRRAIIKVADRLNLIAPGLVKELGFGIFVRKQGKGGGVINLLAQ